MCSMPGSGVPPWPCMAFMPPRLAPATVEPIPHAWDTWSYVAPADGSSAPEGSAPARAAPPTVAAAEETGLDSLLPEEDDELHALA